MQGRSKYKTPHTKWLKAFRFWN